LTLGNPEKQRNTFQRKALSVNPGGIQRSDDMTNITIGGLLKKIQAEIVAIQKLDPNSMEPQLFKCYMDKARVMGYLCATAGQLIEKHDLEKRMEKIEEELDKLNERRAVA